jgi:NADPH:quinone reductase-like Zn-dependent oxidoreductase
MLLDGKFPKNVGSDFAGIVTSIGFGVKTVAVGDKVFGTANAFKGEGSFAQYITVDISTVCKIPSGITFEQAAALPVAGVTADQAINQIAKVKAGQEVLIIGATGGVGLFACQIAKLLGARVTGVCSTSSIATATEAGCDVVVDYTKEDILKSTVKFDVIFILTNGVYSTYDHLLKPVSIFVNPTPTIMHMMTDGIRNMFASKQNRMMMANINSESLKAIGDRVANEGVKVYLAKTFPLAEVKEAYDFAEKGKFIGKVIVKLD